MEVCFEVLTAVSTKMAVFWVVEVYQHFRSPCCLHRPDDGGSKDLRNVGKLLPDYTVLQPRRQPSSYRICFDQFGHLLFSFIEQNY
jgi:hypothetical protein